MLATHCPAKYPCAVESKISDDGSTYDVVVIGGALSGAATATLLLRRNPGLRLLIVEKSAQLSRRVGEATVEISAYFMGRVLGLTQYLNESQLVKQASDFGSKTTTSNPSLRRARSVASIKYVSPPISLIEQRSMRKCFVALASPARNCSARQL
jgi:2-polyprenyl-6-methoxyphenol hydroxylase-like FAD-dependent oxidoreductase